MIGQHKKHEGGFNEEDKNGEGKVDQDLVIESSCAGRDSILCHHLWLPSS